MKSPFIHLSILLIALGVVIKSNCSTNTTEIHSQLGESRSCSMISEKTAVLIAQGALQTSFVESKFDISVEDFNDDWIVRFATKCEGCDDGHPYVVLKKTTGEVSQVFRYGEPEKVMSPAR